MTPKYTPAAAVQPPPPAPDAAAAKPPVTSLPDAAAAKRSPPLHPEVAELLPLIRSSPSALTPDVAQMLASLAVMSNGQLHPGHNGRAAVRGWGHRSRRRWSCCQ